MKKKQQKSSNNLDISEINLEQVEFEKEEENKQNKISRTIKSTESYNRYAERDEYEKKSADKLKLQNQFNYYFVVYFETDEEKNDFCKKHNLDYDFVYGEDLQKIIKEK